MGTDVEIRTVTEADDAVWHRALNAAFSGTPDPAELEIKRDLLVPGRRLGAFVGDRMVGTAGSFAFGLSVPGAASVGAGLPAGADGRRPEARTLPVAGVSGVSVAATHRRRGILRELMARQLDDVAARGETVAVLNASEGGIYRRFGYGIASHHQSWEIDPRRVAFAPHAAGADLDLRLLVGAEAIGPVAAIYDTWRAMRPGALSHDEHWWRSILGPAATWIGGGSPFVVLADEGDGRGGYAVYTVDRRAGFGEWRLDVRHLVATDDRIEAGLWRYLTGVDLVGTLTTEMTPMDCPLRWWLTDPRQVRTTRVRDWYHVRIVDVAAALAARSYRAGDEVVLDVVDAFRPGVATSGRFLLTAEADGEATCAPTGREADLALDIAALGSLYLGGVAASDLARAGLIRGCTAGALDRADALFVGRRAPFGLTHF